MLMSNSSMARWVRIFVVLLGWFHISLVRSLRTLSNLWILSWKRGLHSTYKLCWLDDNVKDVEFCLIIASNVMSCLLCFYFLHSYVSLQFSFE